MNINRFALKVEVSHFAHDRSPGSIEICVVGLPGCQAIHVAVVHAKSSGNQDRVVNLQVRSPLLPRAFNILAGHVLSTLPNLSGDGQQRLELLRNVRARVVLLYIQHQPLIPAQVVSSDGAMDILAIVAIVL